jgi:hypothetical protein
MRLKVAIIISKVDGHHEKEEALNLLCVMPGNLTKMEAAPVRRRDTQGCHHHQEQK